VRRLAAALGADRPIKAGASSSTPGFNPLCRSQEDDRILRVVYNPNVHPPRIVTVFFDRKMKGRL
jgi:hypothetical protein